MAVNNPLFNEVYKTYYSRIVQYISMLAVDNADDVAQEVFLKVYNALYDFENKSSIYTWIYRIATNHVIDIKRKEKKIEEFEPHKKNQIFHDNPPIRLQELQVVQKEMNECIWSYINELPANYRAVFILKDYESMSINEISDIMNTSKENVKKMISRARKMLKSTLNKKCQFYYNEMNQFSCEKKL